ncbi:MAG: penicillin acylase family protein, partial [Alphaproteobacteria bacterium]|nr:penicillin acylase family protein [Alphaproteobacteria bacterium]
MSEVARIAGHEVRLGRTEAGVATIVAGDIGGFLAGLGYVHARDRGLQLWLTRLIAQGRLCECLKDDPVALGVDGFMRRHGFSRIGEEEVGLLPEATRQRAALYAEGIAAGLAAHGIPFEFRLVGYRPEPWRIADTLAIIALMGYAGLAQTQQDIEKFIIQAIAAGVDLAGLKRLFAPHLDGVESSVIEAIRSLILIEPLTPGFPPFVPVARASNNWVVAGTRSASGKPLFATDPHLEINRLPAVWAEVVGRWGQGHGAGITAPGIPGLVMGRTDRIAFGLTYGFMDQIDHVIEEIKDGKARRQGGWEPLRLTKEVIRRKGAADHVLTSISTSHGLLECGDGLPKDGRYL